MGHDRLKTMKDTLMAAVEGQLCNIHEVDAKELGEAIDMIKDLEEAIYYCVIVEAMEEKEEGKEWQQQPQQMMYYPQRGGGMNYFHERYPMQEPYYRDMDREGGRMYYNGNGRGGGGSNGTSSNSSSGNGNGSSSSGNGGTSYFGGDWSEREYPFDLRDYREGRSPKSRKMYMESKEMHKDKSSHLRELEKYMQELTTDIVEMIEDASAEEKQYLEKKIASLAQKISQLNA